MYIYIMEGLFYLKLSSRLNKYCIRVLHIRIFCHTLQPWRDQRTELERFNLFYDFLTPKIIKH